MRTARVSAMALVLAALPSAAEAQEWWDWTLRESTVQAEVGNGPERVRGALEPVHVPSGRVDVRRADRRYDDRYDDRRYDDRYDDRRYDDRYDDRRYDDRYDDRRRGKKAKKGPAFCRNGRGHPVHGRRWCAQKGFGYGGAGFAVRWERRYWDDVIFGRRWYRAGSGRINGRALVNVVGRSAYGRLDLARRRLGGRADLSGRWVRPRGGTLVLQVRSGSLPIAELSDLNGDGRVDVVVVARL